MYPVKKMRKSTGLIYIRLDLDKKTINQFISDFLTAYDPGLLKLYSEKKFDFRKREDGTAFFIEAKALTMVVLDSHVFIHTSDEDKVIDILQSLIELTR